MYYNYKHFFSIILVAICDANCRFILATLGSSGRDHDSYVWDNSDLAKLMEEGAANIPEATGGIDYHLVSDDAFKLSKHVTKGYPGIDLSLGQRVFNYRMKRARIPIEMSFGYMANKFRLLQTEIATPVNTTVKCVMAILSRHNLCIDARLPINEEVDLATGAAMAGPQVNPARDHRSESARTARAARDALKDFFQTKDGAVSWQFAHVM